MIGAYWGGKCLMSWSQQIVADKSFNVASNKNFRAETTD